MFRIYNIGKYERGLLFRKRDFVEVLKPGRYLRFDPLFRLRVEIEDVREPKVASDWLDVIVPTGALDEEATIVNLADGERALVWVDERFRAVLAPGLYAFWNVLKRVRVETIDATRVRLQSASIPQLEASPESSASVDVLDVPAESSGLFYLNGVLQEVLEPGRYAFWKNQGRVEVRIVERRERVLDVSGQEIMTADKVTLRLNAIVTYVVEDPLRTVQASANGEQAIYRDVQLALRAIVGARSLDALLEEKDQVARELEAQVSPRLQGLGFALASVGIKDVILPGEMKNLLNKVTEARKAAEANLITRREETAAVRSQLNAARLLESNPTLMRLRELEVLEKVSANAQLNVVLGESGLTDRVIKLL